MAREEMQAEIDALRREHRFDADVEVKVTKDLPKGVYSNIVFCDEAECESLRIVMFIDYGLLKRANPVVRSALRREFAYCLVHARMRKEGGLDGPVHCSQEWFTACEALGIAPAASFEVHDPGYYRLYCQECGEERHQLRYPEWDHLMGRQLCPACRKPFRYEVVARPICLADGKVYVIEEDGRETLLPFPADELV